MIAVIDYGMGNLRSVQKALETVGAEAVITQNGSEIARADKVVLPGVGASKPEMVNLQQMDLTSTIQAVITDGKPFLGICLGYQLLYEKSDEGDNAEGFGFCAGAVKRFKTLKVPHMGWNQLTLQQSDCPLFNGVEDGAYAYFCHSFFVDPADKDTVAASTDYGVDFASAVWKDNLYAVQFHPEKSQSVGLKILENFKQL